MTLAVGQTATRALTVTDEHVRKFAEISGDYNPLHFDPAFAAGTKFGRLVVQGGLTTGLLHALVAMDMPGPGTVFLSQQWKFTAPVFIGDTITAHAEVRKVHERSRCRSGRARDATDRRDRARRRSLVLHVHAGRDVTRCRRWTLARGAIRPALPAGGACGAERHSVPPPGSVRPNSARFSSALKRLSGFAARRLGSPDPTDLGNRGGRTRLPYCGVAVRGLDPARERCWPLQWRFPIPIRCSEQSSKAPRVLPPASDRSRAPVPQRPFHGPGIVGRPQATPDASTCVPAHAQGPPTLARSVGPAQQHARIPGRRHQSPCAAPGARGPAHSARLPRRSGSRTQHAQRF